MKKITFLLLFVLMCGLSFAQTFTSDATSDPATYPADMQNGTAPSTAATCGTMLNELTLPSTAVTGIGTLGGANSLESVTLNVTHTWNADIFIQLQDPSGAVTVILTQNVGGNGDGFVNLVLQDGATPLPTANTNPLTGTFAPVQALGGFNGGTTSGDGVWNLLVCDDAGGDVGTVDSWSLTFAPTPTCSTPSGAVVGGITTTSADFSWNNVASATLGYEWGILAPGGDPDVDTFLFSGATGAGVLLDSEAGLSPSTDYVFYVRANCDSAGLSPWSAGTAFTTLAPPPVNDNACDAIPLMIGDASTTAAYTNVNATLEANEGGGSCYLFGTVPGETVWFKFNAPVSGTVRIVTETVGGSGATLTDSQITLFSVGDCTDLTTATEVACDEDDDNDIIGDGSGFQANLEVTGLAPGVEYFFVVDGFGTAEGTFDVALSDPTLSVETFENENTFTYFPNPVRNEFTLRAQKDIQNVSVYNMLGQEVLRAAPNAVESIINMNELSQGAYFVQVTIGDVTETVRILKQ